MASGITPDNALQEAARITVTLANGSAHHIAIAGVVAKARDVYRDTASWVIADEIELDQGQLPAATRRHFATRAKLLNTVREVSRFLMRHHLFMQWAVAHLVDHGTVDDDAASEAFKRMRR